MKAVFWSKVVLEEEVPLIVFLTTRGRRRTGYLQGGGTPTARKPEANNNV